MREEDETVKDDDTIEENFSDDLEDENVADNDSFDETLSDDLKLKNEDEKEGAEDVNEATGEGDEPGKIDATDEGDVVDEADFAGEIDTPDEPGKTDVTDEGDVVDEADFASEIDTPDEPGKTDEPGAGDGSDKVDETVTSKNEQTIDEGKEALEPSDSADAVEQTTADETKTAEESSVLEQTKEFDQTDFDKQDEGDSEEPKDKGNKKGKSRLLMIVLVVMVLAAVGLFAMNFLDDEEKEKNDEEEVVDLKKVLENVKTADTLTLDIKFHEYEEEEAVQQREIALRYDFAADFVVVDYDDEQMYFADISSDEPYEYFKEDDEWQKQEVPEDEITNFQTTYVDGWFIAALVEHHERFEEEDETYTWQNDEIAFNVYDFEFDPEQKEDAYAAIELVVADDYVDEKIIKLSVDGDYKSKISMNYSEINNTEVSLPEIEEEEEVDLAQEETNFYYIAQLYWKEAQNEFYRQVIDGEEEKLEVSFPAQPNQVYLDVNEAEPLGGEIVVVDDEISFFAFYNHYFCAYKSYDTDEVTVLNLQDLPDDMECTTTGLDGDIEDYPPFNTYEAPEEDDDEENDDNDNDNGEEDNDEENDNDEE